jgi:FKBP-type peptidyl-prolyl cis-trans isomerase
MMKLMVSGTLLVSMLMFSCASAQKGEAKLNSKSDSLSYALGISIGENFKKSGIVDLNYDLISKAIEAQIQGEGGMTMEVADAFVRSELKRLGDAKKDVVKKAGEDFLAANQSKAGVVTTASGLQYKVEKEGTGISPAVIDKVTVHYHGTLIDGTVFDSSVDRGQPATFALNQVIPGWTEGLQLMKEGGKTTFYIPQTLAYGSRAQGKIDAFSTLIFEVELIKVEKVDPNAAPAQTPPPPPKH